MKFFVALVCLSLAVLVSADGDHAADFQGLVNQFTKNEPAACQEAVNKSVQKYVPGFVKRLDNCEKRGMKHDACLAKQHYWIKIAVREALGGAEACQNHKHKH